MPTYDALGTVHSLSADTWSGDWDFQNSARSSFPSGFMLEERTTKKAQAKGVLGLSTQFCVALLCQDSGSGTNCPEIPKHGTVGMNHVPIYGEAVNPSGEEHKL